MSRAGSCDLRWASAAARGARSAVGRAIHGRASAERRADAERRGRSGTVAFCLCVAGRAHANAHAHADGNGEAEAQAWADRGTCACVWGASALAARSR